MAKMKITQVRSLIGRTQKQKDTMKSLGFRKINHTVEVETSPSVLGMVKKISHLIKVED